MFQMTPLFSPLEMLLFMRGHEGSKYSVQTPPERFLFSCENQPQFRTPSDISFSLDATMQQRQLIAELESKNR